MTTFGSSPFPGEQENEHMTNNLSEETPTLLEELEAFLQTVGKPETRQHLPIVRACSMLAIDECLYTD